MIDHSDSLSAGQRFALGVEYDGSRFHGWQVQLGVSTVQESLERALSRVASHPVRVITAGRTDTGVHASGQVVHFDSHSDRPLKAWSRGTNTLTPPGLVVTWAIPVSAGFHARFSVIGRSYRYIIFTRPMRPTFLSGKVTWDHRSLNIGQMAKAAAALVGRHDFSAYRANACQSRQPIREIRSLEVRGSGPWVWIDIEADGFLYHMVRNIAGVLMAIGSEERPVGWAREVLESRDRRAGGVTAPPHGLYLTEIRYPEEFRLPPATPPCRFW